MTEVSLDELGPVDYLVVEFPAGASSFTGEMAAELRNLADSGTIRVIDVLILTKDEDGTVEAAELSDIPELGDMPLRPTRVGRVGVIRAPVAKTAVVAAAVTPGRRAPVAKTAVVAAAVTPRVGRRRI
jgi:hypothetical protein